MERLWYRQPAAYWEEALPVGNGRLGAMIYGRTDREIIQLNEESVWSGGPRDRNNPDCLPNLGRIRSLLRQGRVEEAQRLAVWAMSGIPQSQRAYQTLGELYLEHMSGAEIAPAAEVQKICAGAQTTETQRTDTGTLNIDVQPEQNYCRELDLDCAVVRSRWQRKNTCFLQEVIASHPADVLAVHLEAQGEEPLCFSCRLGRGKLFDRAFALDDRSIAFEGDTGGIGFAGALTVSECDGHAETIGEHLVVSEAYRVTLLFSAFTTYRTKEPLKRAAAALKEQAQKSWQVLWQEHVADYQSLYRRVELRIGEELPGKGKVFSERPTDERIAHFLQDDTDVSLAALYFQYGRYLMIAGSRAGGLPLTLQGLWNEDFLPSWDSKYTININLQMNYWPVDICNLSECAEPFFSHLRRMVENGQKTARQMYGCRGFVAHHNTDIYGDTAPQDHYIPASYWVLGGAWLATHIWEHYQFTKDRRFLEENFEILREAVLFFCDFLIEDERGRLVTSPSVSPENTYIMEDGSRGCMCEGPTMDSEILYELFSDFLSADRELGRQDALVSRVESLRERLPELRIGSFGQLMEWREDYREAEPGHRHISHLYAVFPGTRITLEGTPELAGAARISLERRLANGGGHTGWSRAWIILLWAGFREGEKAYENLRQLIGASTFPNMMDFHPTKRKERGKVFQIDGNLGGVTGIAEMLVQSRASVIVLLPALPKAWHSGYVRGLRLRGNLELELGWQNGTPHKCIVTAYDGGEFTFYFEKKQWKVTLEQGETREVIHETI